MPFLSGAPPLNPGSTRYQNVEVMETYFTSEGTSCKICKGFGFSGGGAVASWLVRLTPE